MDGFGLGAGPIRNAELLGGGTQNLLVRFERGEGTYVLRRPPLHVRSNSNETMRREAAVLAALAGTTIPHPALIAACPDEAILGAAFYLMQPVDGFNATEEMPALHAGSVEIRRRMGLALAEAAADLAAVDYRAVGLESLGRADGFLERQVGRWRRQLASYDENPGWPGPAAIPGVDQVAAWLERHRPQAYHPGILHGDYHLANVMFRRESGELAAIVDWELATIGDPLLDLGWLMALWPSAGDAPPVEPWSGFSSASELVEAYRARSGRDLSHLEWYAVLACYKLGIILEGTHARACAGRAPATTGDRLHAKTVALFTRALDWIR